MPRSVRSRLVLLFAVGTLAALVLCLSLLFVALNRQLRIAFDDDLSSRGDDLMAAGAIITENVFGLPGLGQLAVQSVTTQDLPVIVGIVLVASFFVVLANIVVDVMYAVLDPRVRIS